MESPRPVARLGRRRNSELIHKKARAQLPVPALVSCYEKGLYLNAAQLFEAVDHGCDGCGVSPVDKAHLAETLLAALGVELCQEGVPVIDGFLQTVKVFGQQFG